MNNINDTTDHALTLRIMRRIYVVSLLRRALHPVFLKTLNGTVFFGATDGRVTALKPDGKIDNAALEGEFLEFLDEAHDSSPLPWLSMAMTPCGYEHRRMPRSVN